MWSYGLWQPDGTRIGRIHWATDRKFEKPLNGLPTASFRLRLDDPMSDEILSRLGDCLVGIFSGSTLMFLGDIMDVEEIGPGGFYKRVIDRKGLLNQGYSLPTGFPEDTDVRQAGDQTSVDARGLFEEVVPSDVQDPQLRQALVDSHVAVRKVPRQIITFDPAGSDTPGSVAVNAAGPLWRLQKRMDGKSVLGLGAAYDDRADLIIKAMLDNTNAEYDSGVRNGTYSSLYVTQAGTWYFKPIGEAITEMQAAKVPYPIGTPVAFVARDTFDQVSGGPLTGQQDNLTNVWGSAGTTDFQVETSGHTAGRAAVSDANYRSGRWAISGAANQSDVLVGIDYRSSVGYASGNNLYPAVVARYENTSNFLMCFIDLQSNQFCLDMMHDGLTPTNPLRLATYTFSPGGPAADTWYSIRLLVDSLGNYSAWHYATADGLGPVMIQGRHDSLASTGDLPTGKVGFSDALSTGSAVTRIYDNFLGSAFTGPQSFDFELAPIEPTAAVPPKIADLNVAYQIGTVKPEVIFEPGRTPAFGNGAGEYIVGDYVRARQKDAQGNVLFGLDDVGNPLYWRVYNIELTINEEGKENLVPLVVPE